MSSNICVSCPLSFCYYISAYLCHLRQTPQDDDNEYSPGRNDLYSDTRGRCYNTFYSNRQLFHNNSSTTVVTIINISLCDGVNLLLSLLEFSCNLNEMKPLKICCIEVFGVRKPASL